MKHSALCILLVLWWGSTDVSAVASGGNGNAGVIVSSRLPAPVGGGAAEILAFVNDRAAAQQRVRGGWAAIVLQRVE